MKTEKTSYLSAKEFGAKGQDVIAGRNAVNEALRAGRNIESLYVARGSKTGSLTALLAKAREQGITIKEADSRKLDFLCGNAHHQGVAAIAAIKEYAQLEDIFTLAQQRAEPPFIILADELEDPYNLGAILRTAECTGAHGVIIPKRRAAGLTYAVGKASAGAVEYVPVVRVTNMASTVDLLKEKGVWIYSTDLQGDTWCTQDYCGALALVIGSEGSGVSRLIKQKADFTITLPMLGKIGSLNASVACGVLCYEIARQRQRIKAK